MWDLIVSVPGYCLSFYFDIFRQRTHSDYMSRVDVDETSFVSRYTTHIKCAKCSIKLDSHFKVKHKQ